MNPRNRTLMIVFGAIGVVLIAAAAAFFLSGGDDNSDSASGSSSSQSGDGSTSAVAVQETAAIEISGTVLPTLVDPSDDPAVGLAMPVIAGESFDGSPITIGGTTEGPTMYVFLAHWCPHCNDEIPELLALQNGGDIPEGLDVVGVSTAVFSDRPNYPPSEWVVDKGWQWPVMADDDASTAFITAGGSGFPYTVLVGADGNVIAREAGNRPADVIKAWLDASLAGASS